MTLTRERAQEIIGELTLEDDGQKVPILLELINGIGDKNNALAVEVISTLYAMTDHAKAGLERFLAV